MSTLDAATAAAPIVLETPMPKRKLRLAETWWRHVVAFIASLFALFPVWFVISAALNRDQSVSGTTFLPTHFTLKNFSQILHGTVRDQSSGSIMYAPFLRWCLITIVVALVSACSPCCSARSRRTPSVASVSRAGDSGCSLCS